MSTNNKNNESINNGFETLKIVNSWINSADTKTSILIGIITLILGFSKDIFSSLAYIKELADGNIMKIIIVILDIIYILLALLAILCCYFALTANIKITNLNSSSPIFFGSISKTELEDYTNNFLSKYTNDSLLSDLPKQIHINSKIANKKFKFFRIGLLLSILLFILTIILLILINLV